MTSRQQQIEQVAGIIAANILLAPAIGDEEEAFAYVTVQCVNREGWTFHTSAPLGHTIRHEGVVLTELELRQAWQLAQQLAAVPA